MNLAQRSGMMVLDSIDGAASMSNHDAARQSQPGWVGGSLESQSKDKLPTANKKRAASPRCVQAPDCYSFKDLVDKFNRPIETVRSWRKRGLLPRAIKIGGTLFWEIEEFNQWLETKKERGVTLNSVKSNHRSLLKRGSK